MTTRWFKNLSPPNWAGFTGSVILEPSLGLSWEGQEAQEWCDYPTVSSDAAQRICRNCLAAATPWVGISQHPKGQGKRRGLVLMCFTAGVCLARAQVRCLRRAAQLTEVARSSPRHRCSSPPRCIRNHTLTQVVETIPSSRWPHLQKYFWER